MIGYPSLQSLNGSLILLVCLLALMLAPIRAEAQVPDTAGIGQLQRQFEVKPQPQSKPPVVRETPQPDPLVLKNGEKTFVIREVKFSLTQVIPHDLLQERIADFINQPVTVDYVTLMAESLTDYIREQGYLISRVVVPPQQVNNGVLNFRIVEQGLEEVLFVGDDRLIDTSILYTIKESLLADFPLEQSTLDQALMTLNRLPGVSAEAVLFPIADNKTGIKIIIKQNRFQGFSSIDNRGSNYVGPWKASIGSTLNGVINPFDQFFLRGLSATDNQELRGGEASYQIPLSSDGTALKVSALRVWSEPGYTLKAARLENISTTYSASIKHPLVQERSRTVALDTQFNIRNASSKTFGNLISDDKTRSISTGLSLDTADSMGGSTYITGSFVKGLDIFGARKSGQPLLSRANGRSDFSKVEAYFSRTQALTDQTSFQLALNGQYALTQLLSGDEFAYGDSQFGRGYNPSELSGDHGLAALFELQHRPDVDIGFIENLQLYSSYDFGSVWAIDTDTRFNKRTGASAALGFRFDIDNQLMIDAQIAKPLTRPIGDFSDTSSNNPRAFMSATMRF